jgi:hypothetical protein
MLDALHIAKSVSKLAYSKSSASLDTFHDRSGLEIIAASFFTYFLYDQFP